MRTIILIILVAVISATNLLHSQSLTEVGLYRTFERSLENDNAYSNKFSDVELSCTYISPSRDTTDFIGFFDGDGAGGGDLLTGNIWKIRFMPDELGQWVYTWSWSDTTLGGQDTFMCVSTGAGKGILRPYENNPRWFAYNGTDPVWLKSYYESGHGAIAQPFDWITANVYQPMIDSGYNHLQVNWLLSLCCFEQYYHDGPAPSTSNLALYENGKASSTMRMDVWQMMEQNVAWLNERNIGLHMFLGFDGDRNDGPAWDELSESEKDFYVKYVIARLAPYANIAGWSFVWEVPGDRLTHELGWARLVQKYDVFNHLRTYQDEHPNVHQYHRPEYNFAATENHNMYSTNRDEDRKHWKEAWTHHDACLAAYIPGKPVYMIEGNALWRRYWAKKCGATQDDLRQAAWACITAGASFSWCGHEGEESLVAFGPQGLPFYGDDNVYKTSAFHIDILSDVMNNELTFYRMEPTDSLLSEHNSHAVWCLSEAGEQYLVFSTGGSPFKLKLAAGEYKANKWINAKTGSTQIVPAFTTSENEQISFTPPDNTTDWVLLVRKDFSTQVNNKDISSSIKVNSTIFPNPCSEHFNIKSNYEIDAIRVFDNTGKSVLEMQNIGQTNKQVSFTNFPQGMYLLYIISANTTTVEKFLKQ